MRRLEGKETTKRIKYGGDYSPMVLEEEREPLVEQTCPLIL